MSSALTASPLGPPDRPAPEADERRGRRSRVLVVDDDRAIREMVSDTLTGIFEVESAASGEEALEVIRRRAFDLIISDQMMPGMTGTDFLEQSIALSPDSVRMLMTASRQIEYAVEAVNRAKVDRFFVKPVRLMELRQQALDLVRQRRSECELRGRIESLRTIESRQNVLVPRVLVVDDDEGARLIFQAVLEDAGYEVVTAVSGHEALDHLGGRFFNVLVMDKNLPDVSGLEVLRLARRIHPDVEAVMVTAYASTESAIEAMEVGVYDYLRKPLEHIDLLPHTVHRALERQALARERQQLIMDLLDANRALVEINDELVAAQDRLRLQMEEMELLQDATVMGLTRLAEYRDMETGGHLERMRNYARVVAEQLVGRPGFDEVDARFVTAIYKAAPLHDIGKVGIPDRILCKPGNLTQDEWVVMRTHATIGGQTLEEAEQRAGRKSATYLLRMGKHIAYYHHERWDGGGYPFEKAGEEIPVEARIVTVADAYDAITSRRRYKESIPHAEARQILISLKGKRFDPRIVDAFLEREKDILEIKERFGEDDADLR